MENTILDLRKWYSVQNVCNKLECDIRDIQYLLENKQLNIYTKLKELELLGYEPQNTGYGSIARAKIIYSGVLKIHSFGFNLDYFQTENHIQTKSYLTVSAFTIIPEGEIHLLTTKPDLPLFVPKSFIKKWAPLAMESDCLDLEYCVFPTKAYTPVNGGMVGTNIKCDVLGLSEDNLNSIKQDDGGYEFTVSIIQLIPFDSLLFSAKEIEVLCNTKDVIKPKQQLKWYESLDKKHPMKKVVELLYIENKEYSARNLWQLLKNDTTDYYDPELLIERVGTQYIYFQNRNSMTFKTFENIVSKCRKFYRT